MTLREKIKHKYALSEQGTKDMMQAFVSVSVSNILLMLPVGLLYSLVRDYMEGTLSGRGGFYAAGCIVCLVLIALATYVQ